MLDANTNRITTIYDGAGQQLATVDALGNRTTQIYDAASQQLATVDAINNRTTCTYDVAGRKTRTIDPLGNQTTFAYDGVGQRTLLVEGRGNRTTYVYDALGRRASRHYSDATRVTFAYDAVGNRETMHDSSGRTSYSYDSKRSLVSSVDPAGKRITHIYDSLGRQSAMIEPEGGRFTYNFDAAGRLDHLLNPQGDRTTTVYDAGGRITLNTSANGTKATYIYDSAGRITRLANLKSDETALSQFDYAYEVVGNGLHVVEGNGNRVTWVYDDCYHLTREQRSGANSYDVTYTYDSVGNRLTELQNAITTTHAYDTANQLVTRKDNTGTFTYTYDSDGNRTVEQQPAGSRTTYLWDVANRATNVQLASGAISTFIYNAEGKRIQKEDSTGKRKFLWTGEKVLLETDGSDIIQVVYTHDPQLFGGLASQRDSGATHYYHFEGRGSTDRLTNGSETVTDNYIYDSLGNIISSNEATSNPFRFSARSGFYHDNDTTSYSKSTSQYEPATGLFISRNHSDSSIDHIQFNQMSPGGLLVPDSSLVAPVPSAGAIPPFPSPNFFIPSDPYDCKRNKSKMFTTPVVRMPIPPTWPVPLFTIVNTFSCTKGYRWVPIPKKMCTTPPMGPCVKTGSTVIKVLLPPWNASVSVSITAKNNWVSGTYSVGLKLYANSAVDWGIEVTSSVTLSGQVRKWVPRCCKCAINFASCTGGSNFQINVPAVLATAAIIWAAVYLAHYVWAYLCRLVPEFGKGVKIAWT